MKTVKIQDMLEEAKNHENLDVDTSFLDVHRHKTLEHEEQEAKATDTNVNDAASAEHDDLVLGSVEFGGTATDESSDHMVSISEDSVVKRSNNVDAVLDFEDRQKMEHQETLDISTARKSDQRDAIQAGGVTTNETNTSTSLPDSGFRILNQNSQPHVRNLPKTLVDSLRELVRAAAVRERGVADEVAQAFSQKLSQAALVTAFIIAQLDVRLDTDAATKVTADLFRSQDPLLGAVVARMTVLEDLEQKHSEQLKQLQSVNNESQQTHAVIEQLVSYLVADKTENFLRGTHNIHDAPITDSAAIFIRDKAREETKKRIKYEKNRDGRPIR